VLLALSILNPSPKPFHAEFVSVMLAGTLSAHGGRDGGPENVLLTTVRHGNRNITDIFLV